MNYFKFLTTMLLLGLAFYLIGQEGIDSTNHALTFDESLEPIKDPAKKSWSGYYWGLGISLLIILTAVIYRKRTS